MMDNNKWPSNFPDRVSMLELLRKMSKFAWQNDNVFTSEDIRIWLDNFTGRVFDKDIEQRIALWMLCNFTYYNESEINHLCHFVFKMFIHNIATVYDVKNDNDLELLYKRCCFAALGAASESGGLLLYHFRQESGLSLNRFYYPSALPHNKDGILVFIDDVTLSGDTASRFFRNNIKSMTYDRAYYLTLFSSDEAIDAISRYGINVIQATRLGDRERCFTDQSLMFANFPELKDAAKQIALEYGTIINPGHPLGHKNGQYCFGLYYNTPNNSLPIFWSSRDWTPIFPRKEKKYHDRYHTAFDRFI